MKRVGEYCLIVVISQEEFEVLSLAVLKRDRVLLFSSVSLCWCVVCVCVCVFSATMETERGRWNNLRTTGHGAYGAGSGRKQRLLLVRAWKRWGNAAIPAS